MNPKYRFFLQINEGGEKFAANPVFSDDVTLDYELENNQRFYRAKLSGTFKFVRQDFARIMAAAFDTVYYFYIEKSNDWGQTWTQYYKSMFMRTDCTINDNDQIITVQPNPIDQYNDVLAGLEKEYNIISLTPEIERITLAKRPLIQIYIPGENIVSCFLGGMSWEQECEIVTNESDIVSVYYFALIAQLRMITINTDVAPEVNGTYVGDLKKNIYYSSNGNYIKGENVNLAGVVPIDVFSIYSNNDELLYRTSAVSELDPARELHFRSVNDQGEITGDVDFYGQGIGQNVYARYLLDVDTILDLNTYPIPTNDIVANNRNYRHVIGYAIENTIAISTRFSTTPTEYGLYKNNLYYAPPYSIFGQKFYPIGRTKWLNYSIWFNFYAIDELVEESGRKQYVLRDNYPVSSIISVLLRQFAPNITHEPTPEYSQILYNYNPITGNSFKLFVTPKSNILVGEYQSPTQKALTTLRQFLDMLRNTFQLYWHIEDNKLRIEHISWYRNGGQYGGSAAIGYDLTQLRNVKNGKEWAFATSEYKFDKEDMPERYQFAWMDDVTEPFDGQPIQILSKYVQPGKIEEINIGGFTSDVDYMLLNPEAISQDGFALFAAVNKNGQYELPFVRYDIDNVTYYLQNGYLAMVLLQPQYWLDNMPARNLLVNNNEMWAYGIQRRKSQDITFPVGDNDPDVLELVKTNIGNGEIQKISINLSSRTAKATLKYDTE